MSDSFLDMFVLRRIVLVYVIVPGHLYLVLSFEFTVNIVSLSSRIMYFGYFVNIILSLACFVTVSVH